MPGYVKVGKTTGSVEKRMRELDSTGVPLPFECFYAARVSNCDETEKLLHDAFKDRRVRLRREFFEVAPERIVSALRLAALEDVTPLDDITENADDKNALNKARDRRGRFNFGMVKLAPGTLLRHVKDNEVTCKIIDNHQVEFENEIMSLSKSALKVVHNLGYKWKTLAGPSYWEYDGKTLDTLRQEILDALTD